MEAHNEMGQNLNPDEASQSPYFNPTDILEQTAEALLMRDATRNNEIKYLTEKIEAQQKTVSQLRKNKGEILFQIHNTELNIKDEDYLRDFAKNSQKMIDKVVEDTLMHGTAAHSGFDKYDEYYELWTTKLYEPLKAEKVKTELVFKEEKADYDILLGKIDKLHEKISSDRKKLSDHLAKELEASKESNKEGYKRLAALAEVGHFTIDESFGKTERDLAKHIRRALLIVTQKNKAIKNAKQEKEEQKKMFEAEIVALEQDIDTMGIEISQISRDHQSFLQQEDEQNTLLASMNAANEPINAQCEKLLRCIKSAEEKSKPLLAKEQELISEENLLNQNILEVETSYFNEKAIWDEKIHELEKELAAMNTEANIVAGGCIEIERQKASLSSEIALKTANLDDLLKKQMELEGPRELSADELKLIEEEKTLTADIETKNNKKGALDRLFADIVHRTAEKRDKLEKIHGVVDTKDKELAELQTRSKSMEQYLAELKNSINNMECLLPQIDRLNEAYEENRAMHLEVEEKYRRVCNEADECEKAERKKIDELRKAVDRKSDKKKEYDEKLVENEETRRKMSEQLEKLYEEMDNLQADNIKYQAELEAETSRRIELTAKARALEDRKIKALKRAEDQENKKRTALMAKQKQDALKKKRKKEIEGGKAPKKQETSAENTRWADLMKDVVVKAEKVTEPPLPVRTSGQKKFFKNRDHAKYEAMKTKSDFKVPRQPAANPYDYSSDSDCQVVFEASTKLVSSKKKN